MTPVGNHDRPAPRVAVVGAGFAGLAAAYRIAEAAPRVSLAVFDAASRVGGIVQTVHRGGYTIERSADSFITDPPHAVELCRRLGIEGDLIGTSPAGRRALIVRGGKLLPVPEGFVIMSPRRLLPLVRSPVLSLAGRLRVLGEVSVPPRSPYLEDESVAAFARRRFGDEAYERLIQPLVGGIYTGDPEKLSMAATMPRFWEAERTFGSLMNARRGGGGRTPKQESLPESDSTSGARYSLFLTHRRGMSAFAEAIAEALPAGAIRLHSRVARVRRVRGAWQVTTEAESETDHDLFDAVVVAVPGAVAADLMSAESPPLCQGLRGIESAGASVVCLGYRREQIAHSLDAFGFVVPKAEGRQILAGSFLSNKFEHRAPAGSVLVRVFVGGSLQAELVDLPDKELSSLVQGELTALLGVTGSPHVVEIARWHGAMPQYHVGHLARVAEIERRVEALPGLALAGNAYRGVGIAPCIRSGEQAARRILEFLGEGERALGGDRS